MAGQNYRDIVRGKDARPDLDDAADDTAEVDGYARLGDQIGGRFIEPACRGDQPVEPVEGVLDNADRALGTLIVCSQRAAQWFDRLADDRDWRLEGVGIIFRCLPNVGGRAMQGLDHPIEFSRDIGELWKVVAIGERARIRS